MLLTIDDVDISKCNMYSDSHWCTGKWKREEIIMNMLKHNVYNVNEMGIYVGSFTDWKQHEMKISYMFISSHLMDMALLVW